MRLSLSPLSNPPVFSKKQVISGVVLLFLIISLNLTKSFVEPPLKPEEIQIKLAEEIYANPILEDRNIWKVDRSNLQQEDLVANDTLDSMDALEKLIENSFASDKETPINLTEIPTGKLPSRQELSSFDIRSKAEKRMMKVANSRITIHTVKAGETIYNISRMYGIDVQTIIGANSDASNLGRLHAGQELKILGTKGVLHRMNASESIKDVARLYHVSANSIISYNGLKNRRIKAGDTVVVPGANPVDFVALNKSGTGQYLWPVRGKITSLFGGRWGQLHAGIDISVPIGTPVKAAKSGRVTVSRWWGAYGYAVEIKHADNTVTRYGHNSKLIVAEDQYVYQGQIIALSGNTGRSTGPHVHFEIRIKGKAVNPMIYLK